MKPELLGGKFLLTEIVLEKMVDLGLPNEKDIIYFSPGRINLEKVESYRESTDRNGDVEDYTCIKMASGHVTCINMKRLEFEKILSDFLNDRNQFLEKLKLQ